MSQSGAKELRGTTQVHCLPHSKQSQQVPSEPLHITRVHGFSYPICKPSEKQLQGECIQFSYPVPSYPGLSEKKGLNGFPSHSLFFIGFSNSL